MKKIWNEYLLPWAYVLTLMQMALWFGFTILLGIVDEFHFLQAHWK